MRIAIVKNNNHYHYREGKKFMVFSDSVYNVGQVYCNVNSDTAKNYMDIIEYSNTLQKEFTGEIIRYVFSDDAQNTKIIKEYYTKNGEHKKTKEIKNANNDFYISLLNDGFIPLSII